MKKKIVHIITGLGNGGAESMLYKLVTNMDYNLYDITVISLLNKGVTGLKLEEKNINVINLNINKFGGFIRAIGRTKKTCKSADVIQTWMYHADLFGFIIAKVFSRKKLIWGIRHGVLEKGKDKKSTIIIAKINALLSKYVDEIVCCSQVSKDYHESIGYKRIKVIPNGFDIKDFDGIEDNIIELKKSLNIEISTKVLVSIGRWNKSKNYPNLIKAISLLKDERKDFICLLVGNGLLENEELSNLISKYNVGECINILGQRSDVPQILAMSDIFVLHSDIEGFSNVLGEAMLSNTFCIATDVGDNRYILADCGIIIEKNNPVKLNNAIKYVLDIYEKIDKDSNKILLETCKEKGKNRIKENFSIQYIVKEFYSLY